MTDEMQNPPDGAGSAGVHTFGDSVQLNCIADAARALAASGWRIFPLQPNDRTPKVKGWQHVATCDAATVALWWARWPNAGIGIATGQGLVVLDVDVKDGKPGLQSLQALQAQHEPLPPTRAVTTPSGGRHFYYRCDVLIRNSASRIKDGLDIRGDGGFVIAPPTIIHGRAYQWANTLPIASAPDWLVNLAGRSLAPPAPGRHRTILDPTPAQLHDVKAALDFLDPGPRDTWIAVAAALRCLGPVGHTLWRAWSMRSEKWRDGDEKVFLTVEDDRTGLPGLFALAQAKGWVNPRSNAARAKTSEKLAHVELRDANSIEAEPISWLWPGWIARRKVHVVAGAPATGKTTIALSLAACVTAGKPFPSQLPGDLVTRPAPGRVLIWSGEDDLADTLVPRLQAAGADLSRVQFIDKTVVDGESRPFDPAQDMPKLEAALAGINDVSMLIIDPLVSAVLGDSHKNGEVRRALQPLVNLATNLDAAVLGITHYTKGTQGLDPLDRVTGSLAFGALARLVYGTVKQRANDGTTAERALFVKVKTNHGRPGSGFAYTFKELNLGRGIVASTIDWQEQVDGSARALICDAEADPDGDDNRDAAEFLRELLQDGAVPSKQVFADANGAGYSRHQLKRAKAQLGVIAKKHGLDHWTWQFPEASE